MANHNKTLLWEISGKNIQGPSYFFGTMHVKDERAFRGIDFLKERIASSDSFAAEFNLQDADHAQLMLAASLPEGKTLEDYLNPRVYKKLSKIVTRESGHSLENFKTRSPILLLNLISEAQFNSENAMALDSALYDLAEKADKKLLGLETFEQQMSVFAKLDIEEQCRSLKKIATNFKSFKRDLKKTSELYIKGDIQKLFKKAKRSIGNMRKVLLYDRNIKMVNQFEIYASEQSLFAAVGAGHLGGKKGVLRLLKKRGYTVKPVSY